MPRPNREQGRIASAWALSIIGHALAFGVAGVIVAGSLSGSPPSPSSPAALSPPPNRTIEIELPALSDGTAANAAPTSAPAAPLPRGGGQDTPRLDNGTRGRGGEDTAPDPALNLADRDEQMLLSPEVQSRLDRNQIQRIRSAARRASREDWRASREPMELTFLASGELGDRPERRSAANTDPALGARAFGPPRRLGGLLGAHLLPAGTTENPRPEGGPIEGAAQTSAGLGVRNGATTDDHRDSEKLAFARPQVNEGTPSVPSNLQGKPSDTLDSEQEVATRIQSILHASSAGGAQGSGAGGVAGPGPVGAAGTTGPGSKSHALGTGKGPGLDNDPADRRRSAYLRHVLAKIHPLWANAFPKWAAIEGLQGTAIITFTISANGTVASASVTRPSGIPEYDENCRRAVLRAAPFEPLPPELGPSFRWSLPFDTKNPAVRPRNPKADRTADGETHRER